jgi:hypothetical protein
MPGSSKSSRIDLRLILLDRLESLLCGFCAGDVVARSAQDNLGEIGIRICGARAAKCLDFATKER